MKQRLAFIDHSFHAQTRSGDFLRELFRDAYEIVDFWDESWNGGPGITAAEVNASGAEVVYFFQSLMPILQLRQLHGYIVWAPMYDSVPLYNRAFWLALQTVPIKFMTFSATLHNLLLRYGLESISAQYFMDPTALSQVHDYSSVRVFFWQRTDITFTHVKRLLGETYIEHCVVKLNPDPRYQATRPSTEDMERYHIQLVEKGFTSKEEYLKLLASCNVFICPRRAEGIGMSFIEAMAMGLVLVALDHPTMNEYIVDQQNGLFFTDQFEPLTFHNLAEIGQRVHELNKSNITQWEHQTQNLIRFIQTPPRQPRPRSFMLRYRIVYYTVVYYALLLLNKIRRKLRKHAMA